MPAPQLAQRLRVRLVLPPEHMRALLEASSVVVETVSVPWVADLETAMQFESIC
jgi:hypothetical protein